ncbi:MAG: hypothetical protein H0W02_23890 [Ktedonobacteraceae bacterium]|nr:hypothetical protein [Ktedonobacteraceae bacterium]
MELSLRLDTLGLVEMHYLRGRSRYKDWPPFQLLAASRQVRVMAYMNREAVDQLHQQILAVESAIGLAMEDEEDEENGDEPEEAAHAPKSSERESSTLSPSFAQALDRLNELARQRLPEANTGAPESGELLADGAGLVGDEEDALVQLQDAFVQMMEVVRELAEELATDALKLTGRFRCARTNIVFTQAEPEDIEEDEEDGTEPETLDEDVIEVTVELVMVLQLFEEGRAKPDDLPAVELQLDVDDFERLHETLDVALQRERRSRRRPADSPPEREKRQRRNE